MQQLFLEHPYTASKSPLVGEREREREREGLFALQVLWCWRNSCSTPPPRPSHPQPSGAEGRPSHSHRTRKSGSSYQSGCGQSRGVVNTSGPHPLHVCRLYKSLGNYDVVRGIFSGHMGAKTTTRDALEAEERADYTEAMQHYNEVK